MSAWVVFLYVLVVVVSLLLIGIILIQPSKSGGMGAAFGGIGESVFGAQAGSHLTKATVVMTSVFFAIILVLGVLIGHGLQAGSSSREGVMKGLSESAPAAEPAAVAEAVPATEPAAAAAEAVPAAEPAAAAAEAVPAAEPAPAK